MVTEQGNGGTGGGGIAVLHLCPFLFCACPSATCAILHDSVPSLLIKHGACGEDREYVACQMSYTRCLYQTCDMKSW